MQYSNPIAAGVDAFTKLHGTFAADEERKNLQAIRQEEMEMRKEDAAYRAEERDRQRTKWNTEDDQKILNGALAKRKQWELQRMSNPEAPAPEFDENEIGTITKYWAANPTMSNNPQQMASQLKAGKNLTARMPELSQMLINDQDKMITMQDAPEIFQDANVFLANELIKGKDKYGNSDSRKEIIAVYSDNENNLSWEIKVTPTDPSQEPYTAPLTDSRDGSPNAKVLRTPADLFANYVQANTEFMDLAGAAVESALTKTGDPRMLEEIQGRLNNEAVRRAQDRIQEIEEEGGKPLSREQKTRLFVGLLPKGHTYKPKEIEDLAQTLFPKDDKSSVIDLSKHVTYEKDGKKITEGYVADDKGNYSWGVKGSNVIKDKGDEDGAGKVGTNTMVTKAVLRYFTPLAQGVVKSRGLGDEVLMPTDDDKKLGFTVNPNAVYTYLKTDTQKAYNTISMYAMDYAKSNNPERAVNMAIKKYQEENDLVDAGTGFLVKRSQAIKKDGGKKQASEQDVSTAIKGVKTRSEAVQKLKDKGFTHDEAGRPL